MLLDDDAVIMNEWCLKGHSLLLVCIIHECVEYVSVLCVF